MRSLMQVGLAVLIATVSMTGRAAAGTQVPEIEPTSLTAGLGILAASVMMLRARRRR